MQVCRLLRPSNTWCHRTNECVHHRRLKLICYSTARMKRCLRLNLILQVQLVNIVLHQQFATAPVVPPLTGRRSILPHQIIDDTRSTECNALYPVLPFRLHPVQCLPLTCLPKSRLCRTRTSSHRRPPKVQKAEQRSGSSPRAPPTGQTHSILGVQLLHVGQPVIDLTETEVFRTHLRLPRLELHSNGREELQPLSGTAMLPRVSTHQRLLRL